MTTGLLERAGLLECSDGFSVNSCKSWNTVLRVHIKTTYARKALNLNSCLDPWLLFQLISSTYARWRFCLLNLSTHQHTASTVPCQPADAISWRSGHSTRKWLSRSLQTGRRTRSRKIFVGGHWKNGGFSKLCASPTPLWCLEVL